METGARERDYSLQPYHPECARSRLIRVRPVEYLDGRKRLQMGTKKVLEFSDMFIILTVVMFPWMCSYVKTYQIVHVKYVQFMKYPLYPKLLKIHVHKITILC